MDKVIGYWFCNFDRKLRYGDGRTAIRGVTHNAEGLLDLCHNGMHASRRVVDALIYAPGPVLFKVEISGKILESSDKLCGRARTYLSYGVDITPQLQQFARLCALDVVHLWNCPKIVLEFLKSDCSDKKLAWAAGAAVGAARAAWAAEAAARAAARAAWAAARAAWATEAAEAAVGDAVGAARAAVGVAAGVAAGDKQEGVLLSLLKDII